MKSNIQLFFLHFAGGNCYSFDFLIKEINKITNRVDFIPLELPGRGNRMDELLLFNKREAIDDYLKQIKNKRNGQHFVIYGHSMGATLGLSIVKKMEDAGDPPIQFIATGNPGPGVKYYNNKQSSNEKKYLLKDEEFKEELRKLGGVPEVVLTNDELFSFFSKIIRADFQVLEEDEDYEKDVVINTPLNALMGDEENTSNQIDNWSNYTTSSFKGQVLPGNHFFIHKNTKEITAAILKNLS